MFDIRNEKHVEDRSILFIDEERLDDGIAAILRQDNLDDQGNTVVRILTGDEGEYTVIDTAEDAEYLVKALQKAISESWWEA